jgi:hypothetical protein
VRAHIPTGSEWPTEPRPWPSATPREPRSGWRIAGIVLSVVIVVLGLAIVAGAVLFVVSLSHSGSNK